MIRFDTKIPLTTLLGGIFVAGILYAQVQELYEQGKKFDRKIEALSQDVQLIKLYLQPKFADNTQNSNVERR